MGDYADMSWDPSDRDSWTDARYFNRDYNLAVKHDRRRHKIMNCSFCKAGPLQFLEDKPNIWYLAEYDENNELVRHVCRMKRFGKSI